MAKKTNRTEVAQRIAVECSCGKRLIALPQHAGKRLKCAACGQAVVVPNVPSPPAVPAARQLQDESKGMSRYTLISLWSFVGVFALGCVLFLVWHFHSSNQAKIAAANARISQAVESANEWIAGDSSLRGDKVEEQLIQALEDERATNKPTGQSALKKVIERRQEMAADAVFQDAKRQLDDKQITKAMALLRKYLALPAGTKKADAQRLLAEAELAASDRLNLESLIAMSDGEFDRVKTSGTIDDRKVTHSVLLNVRNATVQRNLDKAFRQREETRIATEKRREAERLAALDRHREEKQRRKAEEDDRRRINEPYDLKGDRLGMSLVKFKAKYTRKVKGHNESAPFSSETRPKQEIVTLLTEPWHTDAGIVNCSITFPFEAFRGNAPTIAEVKTKLLVHHFVDGKLYRITAWFSHDGYAKVKAGLTAKHGEPKARQTNSYQNRLGATFAGETLNWANTAATVTLTERFGDLNTSAIIFEHRKLAATARSRRPKPTAKDL